MECPFKKLFISDPIAMGEYRVELTRAADEQNSMGRWLLSLLLFPYSLGRRIYNTAMLIRHAELNAPLSKIVKPTEWISSFFTLFFSMRVVVLPSVMKAILKHPRRDPEGGLFNGLNSAAVFLGLLRDLYPEHPVGMDDFLMTCHRDHVAKYRQPILQFIGPQNFKKHGAGPLEEIAVQTVAMWGEAALKGPLNITESSLTYTTAVISKLLLGHPGPVEVYGQIAQAVDYVNRYTVKKSWKQPFSPTEAEQYAQALATLRGGHRCGSNDPREAPSRFSG